MANHLFGAALKSYADFIKADYAKYSPTSPPMVITFEEGPKYIRVVQETYGSRSVHSFVAKATSGKYLEGTVLKAAGWKAPAKNFPRGSVFAPERWPGYVRWTGVR